MLPVLHQSPGLQFTARAGGHGSASARVSNQPIHLAPKKLSRQDDVHLTHALESKNKIKEANTTTTTTATATATANTPGVWLACACVYSSDRRLARPI